MKKIIAFISTLSLIFTMSGMTVLAQAPVGAENQDCYALINTLSSEEEISRAENGITDIPVTKDMLDSIEAYYTNADGTKEKADVYATVRNLGTVYRSGNSNSVYTLTVVAKADQKTDTGSATKRDTTATGSLTWIDHTGTDNELVSVSGGWTTTNHTLTDRKVFFGVNGGSEENRQPVGNSFSYKPSQTHKGFILHLDTYVDIDGSVNLDLRVVSSFFS